MKDQTPLRDIWEDLLASGGYSLGFFSITLEKTRVRIYHYRTRETSYFEKDESFEGMQQLCRERGYSLEDLLKRHYPKTFRIFNESIYA